MFRIVSTAAALCLLAAPAFAATAKVNLAGKSPADAYARIVSAARSVCGAPTGNLYARMTSDRCVADTVTATVAGIADPQLSRYAASQGLAKLARL